MNKYELTQERLGNLYRIRALKDFGNVKAGDLGGWIESEKNLSQDGNCWVYCNARVYGDALIYSNARICGNVLVYGNARVYDNARVCGDAWIYGNARICGDALVYDKARVGGNARAGGNVRICGDAICSKSPINIIGLKYNVTITDNHVKIGCKQFTLNDALKLNSRWARTREEYEEADEIEYMRRVVVEAIKVRLMEGK